MAVRDAHCTIHNLHNRLAWVTDSAVGLVLSLESVFILGICIVLFDSQLHDGGSRRPASSRTWRILGVVESGTGVLMGGLSIAFIFAAITRLMEREARSSPELAWMTDLLTASVSE